MTYTLVYVKDGEEGRVQYPHASIALLGARVARRLGCERVEVYDEYGVKLT